MKPAQAEPDPPLVTASPLVSLRLRLLGAGFSPLYVKRYLDELAEHRRELIDDALSQGVAMDQAILLADKRLGPTDALANAAIRTARRATFSGRHPFLTFGLGSFFAVPLSMIAAILLAACLMEIFPKSSQPSIIHTWLKSIAAPAFSILQYALPCLIVFLLYGAARRRILGRGWRIGICAIVGLMGTVCQMSITVNQEGHGALSVGIGVGHTSQIFRLLAIVLAAWVAAAWSTRSSARVATT